jgi:hypothetical protein
MTWRMMLRGKMWVLLISSSIDSEASGMSVLMYAPEWYMKKNPTLT